MFLFLGIGLFAFNHPYGEMGWGLVITTILNLNFARFLNIWITTSLVNCSRRDTKINRKFQVVMWMSGLRGAMAYALALKSVTEPSLTIGDVMLIDTLIYALVTILGVGSILNPVLERLGVKNADAEKNDNPVDRAPNCIGRIKGRIRRFDNETFAPLFIK